MLKLKTILSLTNCSILNGNKLLWKCYGPYAHIIEFHDVNTEDTEGVTLTCVINRLTQQVVELELFNNTNTKTIKWIDKYHRDDYQEEYIKKQKEYKFESNAETQMLKSKGKMLKLIELSFNLK